MLALERLFRDDLQDGSLEQLMLLPFTLARRCAGEGDGTLDGDRYTITHPFATGSNATGNGCLWLQVMALTLLLGNASLGFLGAPGVALTVGLKRGGVSQRTGVSASAIPLLIFATAAIGTRLHAFAR